jgi:hypothetical protein
MRVVVVQFVDTLVLGDRDESCGSSLTQGF